MVSVKAVLSKPHVQPKPVKPLYRLAVAAAAMRPLAERKPRDQLEVHGQQEQRGRQEQHDLHEPRVECTAAVTLALAPIKNWPMAPRNILGPKI